MRAIQKYKKHTRRGFDGSVSSLSARRAARPPAATTVWAFVVNAQPPRSSNTIFPDTSEELSAVQPKWFAGMASSTLMPGGEGSADENVAIVDAEMKNKWSWINKYAVWVHTQVLSSCSGGSDGEGEDGGYSTKQNIHIKYNVWASHLWSDCEQKVINKKMKR